MIITDGADLLPPFYLLSLLHCDFVEMGIEGVGKMQLPVLNPCMSDHRDIPPVSPDIARKNDKAIADRMHGMPECLPFSSGDDPVFAKMTMGTESP